MRSSKKAFFLLLLCLSILFTGCTGSSRDPAGSQNPFVLTFLTIGKGDAFLLSTPEGSAYLIDTGKSQDYVQIARALRVLEIDNLKGIFLTHGHKDHVGGLPALLEAFPTEQVYYWPEDHTSYETVFPKEIAPKFGTEPVALRGGETLLLGSVTAQVFLPPEEDTENGNNNSMILMLTHGENKFLMMGDAELEEEAQLMASGFNLKADVLKLGHHGEDDASSPAFLDAVSPSIGLIAGNLEENPESLDPLISERLQDRKIKAVYSESQGLGIQIISDGQRLRMSTLKDKKLPQAADISFEEVDRKGQKFTLINQGASPMDLGGFLVRSVRRDELYLFPESTILKPQETITVACRDSETPGDLIWDMDSVWQKKKDKALLYDRNLNILDENIP